MAATLFKRAVAMRRMTAMGNVVDHEALAALNKAGDQVGVQGIGDEAAAEAHHQPAPAAHQQPTPAAHQQPTPAAHQQPTPAALQQGPIPTVQGGRVTGPVHGLYDSVDPGFSPPGWRFSERTPVGAHPDHPELVQITTDVTAPDGSIGWIQRSYDPKSKTIVMENAFLQELPSWMEAGTPMVSGKGTPTVTYLTLRQMKLLGVHFGELHTVKMSTIQNVEAVMQLEQMIRTGVALESAVAKTHSVRYATTSIEQSGHAIVGIRVDTKDAWPWKLEDMMDHFGTDPLRRKELFAKYGLKADDNVLVNYDILIDVGPHP